jgi:DNA-binding transcriptional regulator YiaG
MTTIRYDVEVRHDGQVHSFTVPELNVPACKACSRQVFNEDVDDQITHALRAHLHLLTPAEMRAALERLGMTQTEVADRLGIPEATFALWLNDFQVQPRAMDTLLRVFFAFPEVRSAVNRAPQDPRLGTADATGSPSPNATKAMTSV